jgi:hypothetical protein
MTHGKMRIYHFIAFPLNQKGVLSGLLGFEEILEGILRYVKAKKNTFL